MAMKHATLRFESCSSFFDGEAKLFWHSEVRLHSCDSDNTDWVVPRAGRELTRQQDESE